MIDISKAIKEKYADIYVDKTIPEAFCVNSLNCNHNIQAIVLGADPSNNSGLSFETVFALSTKDEELVRERFKGWNKYKKIFYYADGAYIGYLGNIYENILALGLNKSNLYIQNLCRNYTTKETSKFFSRGDSIKNIEDIELRKQRIKLEMLNNRWVNLASEWINSIKNEFNEFDPQCKIPVFITTEYLLLPLIEIENIEYIKNPEDYYNNNFIIPKERNLLGRTLVPLYRHDKYKLSKNIRYKDFIKNNILSK